MSEDSFRGRLKNTFALLFAPKMLCLCPLMFFIGMANIYYASQFTRQIHVKANIGYVMAVFAVVDSLGSLVYGELLEKAGRATVLVIGTIAQAVAYVYVMHANVQQVPAKQQLHTRLLTSTNYPVCSLLAQAGNDDLASKHFIYMFVGCIHVHRGWTPWIS